MLRSSQLLKVLERQQDSAVLISNVQLVIPAKAAETIIQFDLNQFESALNFGLREI